MQDISVTFVCNLVIVWFRLLDKEITEKFDFKYYK